MESFQLLLNLIKNQVCQTDIFSSIAEADSEQIERALKMAEQFGLVHIAVNALKQLGFEAPAKLEKQVSQMAMQYIQQDYALKQTAKLFSAEGISFILLKGSVIKKYYPEEWQRNSCDIDILVKNKDIEAAGKILTERMAYKKTGKSLYDISFVQGLVHIELHFELVEEGRAKDAKKLFDNIWDYCECAENSSEFVMNDEMFYFCHIAHMAKHIKHGGCGIKPFIDLWVLNHRVEFDKAKRKELLEKGGLLQFSEVAERLSEVWFSDAMPNEATQMLQEYVLAGGVYGSTDNGALMANADSENGRAYLTNLLFLPYENMVLIYPWLEGRRYLLPVAQIIRICRAVFKKDAHRVVKSGLGLGVTQDDKKKAKELIEKLGI